MTDERRLTALMYRETDGAPASLVDLARVVRDGRRRRNVRRLSGASLVAAGIALALIGGLSLANSVVRRPSRPPDVPAVTGTAPSRAESAFDPRRSRLTVGWVPDGLHLDLTQTTLDVQAVTYVSGEVDAPPTTTIGVALHPPGVDPWRVGPADASALPSPAPTRPASVPAPAVNGHKAEWINLSKDGSEVDVATLAWHWTAAAWASVTVSAPASAQATALRVAGSVRTDVAEPMRLPFTISRPPAALWLASVSTTGPADTFACTLEYRVELPAVSSSTTAGLRIVVGPRIRPSNKPGANQIDGQPAMWDSPDGTGGSITLDDVSGFQVEVNFDTAALRYVTMEQLVALMRSVRPVGTRTDPTTWTADPLK